MAPSLMISTVGRIIVVSHQLPYVLSLHGGKNWQFTQRHDHGSIYSGIRSLAQNPSQQVVHIGWTGYCTDEKGASIDVSCLPENTKQALQARLSQDSMEPVFVPLKNAIGHYEGYCKSGKPRHRADPAELWPLFHYIIWDQATDSEKAAEDFAHYHAVNKAFAEKIAAVYRPGDQGMSGAVPAHNSVFIQDYHLMLLPSMLRELLPDALIGFFLHTPFPSSEVFRCLPSRSEILEGLLGSNLIGFQSYSYARHFTSSCTRVLGLESSPTGIEYNGSQIAIAIFPVGIDVEHVKALKSSKAVAEKMVSFREMYAGKKIIFGRDKLDQINGVRHKLLAFEKFLQNYPEWRNRVVLIQVTTPPPYEMPKLESLVSDLVSRINRQFGSLEFSPIRHYHQHLDQDDYIALLSVADVALVTSIRDSSNSTALEYIICQEETCSPLILSEFSGTAGSLSAALFVNPWDYLGIAQTITEALTLTKEEKVVKHQLLYDHVTRHTAEYWANSFVAELRHITARSEELTTTFTLDVAAINESFKKSRKRLLLFDYDGTLTPIRKVPSAAVPPSGTIKSLNHLASDPNNYVYIISGRDQECLEMWLGGIPGLGMSAEHGCFLKYPQSDSEGWLNLMENMDTSWKNEVIEIFNFYTERTPGSFVELKKYSVTWHYRMADPNFGNFQAKECQNHLENAVLSKLPVEILVGKKNLEVRPVAINKGEIVRRLVERHDDIDFVFCAGDDKTDEDMFRVLKTYTDNGSDKNIVTCTIGPSNKRTAASWHLEHPQDLIDVLLHWTTLLSQ